MISTHLTIFIGLMNPVPIVPVVRNLKSSAHFTPEAILMC